MKKILIVTTIIIYSIATLYPQRSFDFNVLSRHSAKELFQFANQYLERNDKDTAIAYFLYLIGGYESDKENGTQYICARSYIAVGNIYYQQGYYSKAFDSFTSAIKISEENDFTDILPQIYNNLGSIYCTWQDFAQGLFYYEKALGYTNSNRQEELYKRLLINIIGVYCEQKNTQMARKYYTRLYHLRNQDKLTNYFCLFNKGLILITEGKGEKAVKYIRQTCEYAESNQLGPEYTCSAYTTLAQLYEKNSPDSSLYYYRKALTKELHPYMQRELLKQLALLYRSKDKQLASCYTNRYLLLSDSLFDESEINRMKGSQFIYESEKNYQKIKKLNEEKQLQKEQISTQRTAMLIGAIIVAIFTIMVILLIIQKKKLSRAYKDLFFRSNAMLKKEQVSRQVHERLEESIRILKKQLADSKENCNSILPQKATIAEEIPAETDISKQQSVYRLTDEQKEQILSAVNQIMNDTEAVYDCDFSIERLADLTGHNSKYISKVINDTYQCNFRSFINEYRIKEAQKRLLNIKEYDNFTINAIAQSVGYKSHANFILLFRKSVGISPSAYQRMAKEYGTENFSVN